MSGLRDDLSKFQDNYRPIGCGRLGSGFEDDNCASQRDGTCTGWYWLASLHKAITKAVVLLNNLNLGC